MKINSKTIGNDYEREFSRKLSLWFTNNVSDDVCWRDLGSGSRSTQRDKQGKTSIRDGDIVAMDLKYQKFFNVFHVDTKSLGKVHLMLINSKNIKSSQLFQEWKKVSSDATKFNKIPLMFVKARNDRKIPEFILLDKNVLINSSSYLYYSIHNEDKIYSLRLMLLHDFFKLNDWKEFVENNQRS